MAETQSIHQALVVLTRPEGGWRWLLDKPLAGVPVLDRLLFTLSRAGVERIVLQNRDLPVRSREALQIRWSGEPRLTAQVLWSEDGSEMIAGDKALVFPAQTVTTAKTLTSLFGRCADRLQNDSFLFFGEHDQGGFFYLDAFDAEKAGSLGAGKSPEPDTVALQEGEFLMTVSEARSFRSTEQGLLAWHKRHYTQLLDVHFNSYFSIPISSILVKFPVTPNQLTLFGLVIGLASGIFFANGDYASGLVGGFLLAFTAIWDCCDGDVARLKFMESDFGEKLDTICDNVINIFIFTGIAIGVGRTQGMAQAVMPFVLLALGGFSIFALIYFPQGGKGDFFKGTAMYDVILLLASRNFIYIILLFAFVGKLDSFLWLAGWGSLAFASVLFLQKMKIGGQESS